MLYTKCNRTATIAVKCTKHLRSVVLLSFSGHPGGLPIGPPCASVLGNDRCCQTLPTRENFSRVSESKYFGASSQSLKPNFLTLGVPAGKHNSGKHNSGDFEASYMQNAQIYFWSTVYVLLNVVYRMQ